MNDAVTEPGLGDTTDDAPDDLTDIDARIATPSDVSDDVPLTDEAPADDVVAVETGAADLPDEPEGMVAGDDHIPPKEDATDA